VALTVVDAIGNTPLVELRRVVPADARGAGATVGTIAVDSGLRYVSTDLFEG